MSIRGYEGSSVETARLLIDSGANVDHISGEFITLLHYAVTKSNHDMARLLMEHGAQANIPDNEGQTALDCALSKDDQAMVNILRGVEPEPVSCTWTGDVGLSGDSGTSSSSSMHRFDDSSIL